MGFYAAQWAFQQQGLTSTQLLILQRVGWSCRDDDGLLPRSQEWLADKCALDVRTVRRQVRMLEKLELLTHGDRGFRLPQFLHASGNHRPPQPDTVSGPPDRFADTMSERKESNQRKESERNDSRERTPQPPLQRGAFKLTRAESRRIQMLGLERTELHEFTVAWCQVCLIPHEWPIEPYADSSVRVLACPDWRSKLRSQTEVRK